MKNPVIHFEISGRDLSRSSRFYSELFGWRAESGLIDTGSALGIGGHLSGPGQSVQNAVTVYVEVDDLEAALKRAEELGGRRRGAPAQIPVGVCAWFEDPDGNVIGLLKRMGKPTYVVKHDAKSMITDLALFDQSRLLRVPTTDRPDSGAEIEVSLELGDRPALRLQGQVKQQLTEGFLARVHLTTADRLAFEDALRWAAGATRTTRSEPRFPTVFPVTLRDGDPNTLKYVKNLSRKGAFIRTKRSPPVGSLVTVQLKLPDGGEPVDAEVRVVRAVSEEQAAATGAMEGVGVLFEAMMPSLRRRLDAFIATLEARNGKMAIVADDDVLIRTMVSQLLESQGIRVEQASNGAQVLELVARDLDRLSVVVMDLVMPGHDGLELVGELSAKLRPRAVPLVVMTGGGPHMANQAIMKGARRAILKGATPEGILASIESAMSGG